MCGTVGEMTFLDLADEPCQMSSQAALLQKAGKLEKAGDFTGLAQVYGQMLTAEPGNPGIMVELGRAEQRRGRLEVALEHFSRAIARDPMCFAAWCNLGIVQHATGDSGEAIRSLTRAGEIDAKSAVPPLNLGVVLHESGDLAAALAAYHRAATLAPNMPEAHFSLANGLSDAHEHIAAIASYERALKLRPRYVQARWNMAHSLLMTGDHARGWQAFEARWQTGHLDREARNFAQPQWRGEDIAGKTLLLWSEQGFGDIIQFCRYAPLAAARGARVVLGTRPQLLELLGSLADVAAVVDLEGVLPRFDRHCPLMSLPLAFGTTLESIPATTPYLAAPARVASAFGARIRETGRLLVGLVWSAGMRRHDASLFLAGAGKSMPPSLLGVLKHADVEFFSLQVDVPAGVAPIDMTDWSAELKTFADTADLIERLDLVISVDTASAHLAGALGKPVWLLLGENACWRWGRDIATSPWYPTMRVFRQTSSGDWRVPLEAVRLALAELAHKRPQHHATGWRGRLAGLLRR